MLGGWAKQKEVKQNKEIEANGFVQFRRLQISVCNCLRSAKPPHTVEKEYALHSFLLESLGARAILGLLLVASCDSERKEEMPEICALRAD